MIYLLGGTARTGKSILAHRLNQEHGLPVISTDLLRGVLVKVDPGLKSAMEAGDLEVEADVFYPHLRQAIACTRIQLSNALIEGVGFFPRHVVQIQHELDIQVRCCFVGRSSATPKDLFGHATDHRFYDGLDSSRQAGVAKAVVDWSTRLELECKRYALPFVDFAGASFPESLQAVELALLAATAGGSSDSAE